MKKTLAGFVKPGDTIIWDGAEAEVIHADKYRTAMLAGVQVEFLVRSEDFTASGVVSADDYVFVVDTETEVK